MKLKWILAAWIAGFFVSASAQVARVDSPWVRGTATGQTTAGGFMRLLSRDGAQLIGGLSPVAQTVELHDMKTDRGALVRERVPFILLPAGRWVDLNQCGPHILLIGLKQPLTRGMNVPLTLIFKDRNGVESRISIQAPVFGSAAELNAAMQRGVVVGMADEVVNCSFQPRVG